jgi:hypothetical protein
MVSLPSESDWQAPRRCGVLRLRRTGPECGTRSLHRRVDVTVVEIGQHAVLLEGVKERGGPHRPKRIAELARPRRGVKAFLLHTHLQNAAPEPPANLVFYGDE